MSDLLILGTTVRPDVSTSASLDISRASVRAVESSGDSNHLTHKRGGYYRLKNAKRMKLQHRKRKAAGLCSYGFCPAKSELGHSHCREHLESMRTRARVTRNERIREALCIYCGKRPSFWGLRCIICRQIVAKDPLPSGAKRALRLYREREAELQQEEIQRDARAEVAKLLRTGKVQAKYAKALRLYAGLDGGRWRTYAEVARRMNLSKERVRQLLLPSKVALARILGDRVPWSTSQGRLKPLVRQR